MSQQNSGVFLTLSLANLVSWFSFVTSMQNVAKHFFVITLSYFFIGFAAFKTSTAVDSIQMNIVVITNIPSRTA